MNRCKGYGMDIGERILRMRQAEGLTRDQIEEITGIKSITLRQWETGKRTNISAQQLQKITGNARFEKYTLWLMTGKTAPEAGQISPEIEEVRQRGTAG